MGSQLITSATPDYIYNPQLRLPQLLSYYCLRDHQGHLPRSVNSHLTSLFRASNRALGKWGSRARHFDQQRRVLPKGLAPTLCRFPKAAC